MKDFLGRDIRVNDNVVWPTQSGHRIDMRRGQVVKLNPSSVTVRPHEEESLVAIKRVENIVVMV